MYVLVATLHGPLFLSFSFLFVFFFLDSGDPMSEVPSSGAEAETVAETAGPGTRGGNAEGVSAAGDGTGVTRSGANEDGKAAQEGEGGGGREGEARQGQQRGARSTARPYSSPGCSP